MNHEQYMTKEYTFNERFKLGFALEHLAKAMRSRLACDVDRDVELAMRYLVGFINDAKPQPPMSEAAANVSRSVHTYLRKYCDSPNTTLLYNLVSDGIGSTIWVAFCESLARQLEKGKFTWRNVERDINSAQNDHSANHPNNLIMACALKTWGESKEVDLMVKEFEETGWK